MEFEAYGRSSINLGNVGKIEVKMKLETERLILREWSEKDVNGLIEGLNNLDVAKWLAFVPYPYTKKDAEEWIKYCVKTVMKGNDRDCYEFAIELKSEKKLLEVLA